MVAFSLFCYILIANSEVIKPFLEFVPGSEGGVGEVSLFTSPQGKTAE